MNPYYTASGAPGTASPGASATLRAEFSAIQAAFDAVADSLASGDTSDFLTEDAATALYLGLAGGTLTGGLGIGAAASGVPLYVRRTGTGGTFLSEPVLRLGITGAAGDASIQFYANGASQAAGISAKEGALYLGTGGAARLTINAAGAAQFTGAVTAASFEGALTGNVTGNASGSSSSCTGNAATATTAGYAATAGAAATASSASSVLWAGVNGRPTDLASFTNGPGYITAAASITGLAAGISEPTGNGYGSFTVSASVASGSLPDGHVWYQV